MEIKKATIEVAEEILKVQKEAYLGQADIYQNFNIRPLTQTLDSIRQEFSEKTFLIAYLGGELVGTVRYWEDNGIIHIERLAVRPEFQNQGIGTLLMKEVELECPHALEFNLYTGIKSLRNIHVYKKLGYVVFEEKDDGQGIVTLYMRKRLSD